MSTERKMPKPIQVRQRPRKSAESVPASTQPKLATLLTIPNLYPADSALVPEPSPISEDINSATTLGDHNSDEVLTSELPVAMPQEPAIAAPQNIIGPSGDRTAPPTAPPTAPVEVETSFSTAMQDLLGHNTISDSMKRNLGTIGTIAAAIVACTLVAKSMKPDHSATELSALPPVSSAPFNDTDQGEQTVESPFAQQVGQQGFANNSQEAQSGSFQQVQSFQPQQPDSKGSFLQTGQAMVNATDARAGMLQEQMQQQFEPAANQSAINQASTQNQQNSIFGQPIYSDGISQSNPMGPQGNLGTQPNVLRQAPANAQQYPAGNSGNPNQRMAEANPFGTPVAGSNNVSQPTAVDPNTVWPNLNGPTNGAPNAQPSQGQFDNTRARANPNGALPQLPPMPSVHSFNDKTAGYPSTPSELFPDLQEVRRQWQEGTAPVRIGTNPTGAPNFGPLNNNNSDGVLR